MVDRREVAQLVEDRPELAEALETVLAVDEDHEGWTFEDVPVGTGLFGEIVGHDIVESVDDGYRVTDPDTVRAALTQERSDDDPEGTTGPASIEASDALGRVQSLSVGATARRAGVGLVLVALFVWARSLARSKVLRDDAVVLAGNDAYLYRYLVDGLLARSSSPFALGTLTDPSITRDFGEPLFVATLWWVSALLGGTREVAGLVLAWYPVVAAIGVGALVYVLGARVFGDRRVGVLAAGILAVLPAHAMRTSLGFADHHAFDYLWLMATVTVLAWLTTVDDPFGTAGRRGAVLLGVVVTGLVLAWEGSPLMLLPVAVYLALTVLTDIVDGRRPMRVNASVLAGLGGAAVVTVLSNVALGWTTTTVALTPGLLALGGVAVAGGSELLADRGVGIRTIAAVEFAVPLVALVVLSVAAGDVLAELVGRFEFLFSASGIGETASAFTLDQLVGVKLFGGAIVLAVPVLVWAGRRALLGDRRWLVVGVFTWYFLALSVVQLRFIGQLAPLASLLAAVGLVWGLARLDLTTPPVPVRESTGPVEDPPTGPQDDPDAWLETERLDAQSTVLALVLVVAVVGPGTVFLSEKVSGSAVSDADHEAAQWMAEYADERGWTYPDNYVFSQWGKSRAFNYPVNGQSADYGFALANYSAFVTDADPDPKYHQWRDRVGFVVLEPLPPRDNTAQQHLYNTYGSRWVDDDGVRYDAVSHYRAVYVTENGANRVFVLVPGANVTGTAAPNETVELHTSVSIPNAGFTYRTVATADATGHYRATVPYPGEYEVTANNETTTVTVPERAVENGTRVTVDG